VTGGDHSLELLRADAEYSRSRLALYRARVLTARPSSASKLRELERAADGAAERLGRAERAQAERDTS
jgi:hypothetical protein